MFYVSDSTATTPWHTSIVPCRGKSYQCQYAENTSEAKTCTEPAAPVPGDVTGFPQSAGGSDQVGLTRESQTGPNIQSDLSVR